MNSGKMLWFLSWVLWLGSLCAQTTVGTITGTIRDQSGAVLPGVEVKATDPATGRSWSGVSTEDGTYRITNLPPATYEVKAELTGFKTALQKEVKVEVAATQRVDLRLEIGELTEIVTVTGEASTINVEKGEVSAVVDAKKIVDLPLNGRNVFQLAQLQPGIFNVAGANAQSDVTAAGISASGTRFRDNNILLDGVTNNNDRQGGLTTITPNADTVQEFRVVSNNFSAEFGRSGGALVNVITRGGTNAFHGSVYEFHRNDNLDAANVFAAFNPATQKKNKPEFKRNQFGFTAGGPIWKNHTFFFGSYEGDRIPGGVNRRLTVETREFRDFVTRTRPNSIAARLFKEFPASGPPTQNIRDIGSPAPGAGTFGPPDGIPDIGEAFLIIPGFVSRDQYSGRLDHQFNQGKDTLVGRYYLNDLSEQRPGDNSVRGFLTFFDERDQNLGLMETHIFSPRVVNEFRFGFNRDPVVAVPNFPEIPDIAFDDGTAKFSQGFGYAIPLFFFLNTYQYNDIVSINHGNHGIKAGFELRRFQENSEFQLFTRGWFFFSNVLDFADDEPNLEFLRVDPNTGSPVGTPRGYRTLEWGAFIQDDWKVTPNFTLNVGLRYDNFGTLADIRDRISNLTFPSGSTR
ncbi:MAG: TonB-dependent receptor, partial [Acidobacteria bacterium]|nr:TonB-dependent receptor [Acidobacteriota bacterium]